MTNEEMERALEFLVKSQAAFDARQAAFEGRQAAFDARLEQIGRQIAETGRQLQIYAETQSEFIQIVTASMTRLSESQARADQLIAESNARLDEKIADTNARLDRLAAIVERNITGGKGAS